MQTVEIEKIVKAASNLDDGSACEVAKEIQENHGSEFRYMRNMKRIDKIRMILRSMSRQ